MNKDLVLRLWEKVGWGDPPGCVSTFVEHPHPAKTKEGAIEVSFVMDRRFAFYYWIKCKQELRRVWRTRELVDDEEFTPPDLVTWDWRNDCGAEEEEIITDRLALLNQEDKKEVALFCWAGLDQSYDRRIPPAVWLNCIGNVYIVQKQEKCVRPQSREYKDRFGHNHQVFCFCTQKNFAEIFSRTYSDTGVIWDISLDYFRKGKDASGALSGRQIAAMLSPDTSWMPLLLRDLKAVTIALGSEYTGGLSASLALYRRWESSLFATPLFSKSCRWRKEYIERMEEELS